MSGITGIPASPLPVLRAESAKKNEEGAAPSLSSEDQRRLNAATADFESMFIQQLFKSMRKTIPEDASGGLFAKSQGEKIFSEMLDGEYAKNFSHGRSGLGLKEAIFKQTVANQLAQGGKPQNALNQLREGENSLNALTQSPIGKRGGTFGDEASHSSTAPILNRSDLKGSAIDTDS